MPFLLSNVFVSRHQITRARNGELELPIYQRNCFCSSLGDISCCTKLWGARNLKTTRSPSLKRPTSSAVVFASQLQRYGKLEVSKHLEGFSQASVLHFMPSLVAGSCYGKPEVSKQLSCRFFRGHSRRRFVRQRRRVGGLYDGTPSGTKYYPVILFSSGPATLSTLGGRQVGMTRDAALS